MKALEPISIAGVEIPNSVVRTAHSTHFGSGGIVPSLIDYHVERARGGVGLTILEIAGVHPTCPSSICNFDDSVIEGYEQLMRAIRPHGMRVFQQLWHAGHNGVPIDDRKSTRLNSVTNAHIVCRLLLETKKKKHRNKTT